MALSKGFRIFEKKQPNHSIILEHRQRTQEALLFESQAVAVLCKFFYFIIFIFDYFSVFSIVITINYKVDVFFFVCSLLFLLILTTCYVIWL